MKSSKKILLVFLLLVLITASLSSCEIGGHTVNIPGWEAFKEKFGPHVHDMKLVAEVPANCYIEGVRSHYSCGKCNQLFADEAGKILIEAPESIPKTAHIEEVLAAKAPTCTETGLTEGTKCSVCNEIIKEQGVIETKPHTEETVPSVPAGCTNNGLSEGKKCIVCGTVTLAQDLVPAVGHTYDNDQDLTCNTCGSFRCSHNSTGTVGEAKQPTCKEEGLTAGVKCLDCGVILEGQQSVEKSAHTVATDSAVAPGCLSSGLTEGSHCSVCNEVIVAQQRVSAVGHTWNGASCTACGTVKFEAEDADIETDIDRLGAGMQTDKTLEDTNYPSGDGYVYYLSDEGNASLTFYVKSDKAGKAVLSFCFGLSNQYTPDQLFTVTVNGVAVDYYETAIIPKYDSVDAIKYFGWYEVEVADIELVADVNTIVLTKTTKGLNFDYIAIRSTDGASISLGSSDTQEMQTYTFAVVDEVTPFTSVIDYIGDDETVGINTNKYGTFYEHTKGATFTVKVMVEEATTVEFIINVCSNDSKTHEYSTAVTSVTSTNALGDNAVVIHSGTVAPAGWYTSDAVGIEIATISLAQGVNTITFTMGTETSKDLNIASVEFESLVSISLVTD